MILPIRQAPGRTHVPNRRRPTITVEEHWKPIDDPGPLLGTDEAIALLALSADTFESNCMIGATSLQKSFTAHHMVFPDVAIAELRLLAEPGLTNGRYRRLSAGGHAIVWRGFKAHTTPDGECLVAYSTSHFERRPSQVSDGVSSRFGIGKRDSDRFLQADEGPVRPMGEIQNTFDPERCWVSMSVLRITEIPHPRSLKFPTL